MSDERPDEQDPPTARLNLADVAAWLQRSAQQASADDADPAPEEAPAVPEDGPRADAVAPEGSGGASADSGAPAEPDPGEGPPGDASEQLAAPRAEDADADLGTQDAPAVARDVATIEVEAPPFDPEVGTGPDDHGPPEPAGVGEAGSSSDDAPASAPEEDAGNESATPADQSDDDATAWSAPPSAQSDQPEGDQEVGVPGEEQARAAHEPGAGAPVPGPSPVEASPASAEGTGVDEWAGGGERADDLGSAALFELDLAKLAERARASALREAVPASPRPLDPGPEPDPSPITARDLQDPFLAPAPEPLPAQAPILDPFPASEPFPDPFPPSAPGPERAPAPPRGPEPVTAPSMTVDEPAQPVAAKPAPLVWGDATQAFDLSRDEDAEDAETDSTEADTAAGRPQGKAYAPVQAAARTRPAKRPSYPRGQLREPIGILRRIRAMLGIVVVTVLLGVAAGTAVGAFIFFLAFAIRDAITAQ